jgi:hypothetical protein
VVLATLAFALSIVASGPVKVVGPDQLAGAKEPQAAVDDEGKIYVTYGNKDSIYCSSSDDKGQTFSAPVKVADTPKLMIGMRRGPRIAICNGHVVVSAVVEGNLMCWTSTNAGQFFSDTPAQINDTAGSAIEGLHAEASNSTELACAWLDHRENGQEIYSSVSQDGGENWGPNVLVYKSPSGSVCECCHPSVTIGSDGAIHVMFRNSVQGNRDMFVSTSKDDGQTWSPATMLGQSHWKLDACPMDGGAIDGDDTAQTFTIWRRADSIFRAKVGRPETKIGVGVQPWLYAGQGVYGVYLKQRPGPLMMFRGAEAPRAISHDADDPMVAGPMKGEGPVVAVWTTSKGEIMCELLND